VAHADIDEERLAVVAKELTDADGTVATVKIDVSDADSWQAAADSAEAAIGPISILVNNAGANGGGTVEQTPLEMWRWVLSINTDGPYLGTSTFLPRFKQRGGHAHIMNTASMAGLTPMANVAPYVTSKFARVGFSLALHEDRPA
jgi:NAD(P)-dependent dehydrogenase (short-subunit alcohol dehydrogenase family)